MTEQILITADRAHLRIYDEHDSVDQSTPSLKLVRAVDFPEGKSSYTDQESSMSGRFPGSKGTVAGAGVTGMSIDERLPLKAEHNRRLMSQLAGQINAFLLTRPAAVWKFAAPAEIEKDILALIDDEVKRRLTSTLAKDLVNVPADELIKHFEPTRAGV